MKGVSAILSSLRKMLRKILSSSTQYDVEDDGTTSLPEDVKEGHFVVLTVDGGELRRFVLDLSYLADPRFLMLLEKAELEFGFEQTGILVIPCTCSDLQSVIGRKE